MDAKKQVLIVDDSPDDIHVLMENLKQEYAVLAATNSDKALEMAAASPQPDVILLDVMMPECDGYETCRRLKANPETQDIDVIFVSAHDSVEEKLAGYDAGGCDYLIKPVQPSELQQKVRLAINNKEQRAEAAAEQAMAIETAMTAMTNASEQGVAVDFMRRSFLVKNIKELAELAAECTGNYGLDNSVQIRTAREIVNASSQGSVSALEEELMLRLKDAGRLRESGARFIANFGDVSMLIKNMPEDDVDKRGRLRDHLAILLEGAEARARALQMDEELSHLVVDSQRALHDIQGMQKAQKEAAMKIMDDVMKNLEESFLSYGLTEDQEKILSSIVQTGVDKSLENFEQGLKLDERMQEIVQRLEEFARN